MAIYQNTTACITDNSRGWMSVTNTTTTSTTCTLTAWYTYTACNYTVTPAEPPRLPPEYLTLRKVVLGYSQKPQIGAGRITAAALPRGKLSRWKSLKEKRASWGIN